MSLSGDHEPAPKNPRSLRRQVDPAQWYESLRNDIQLIVVVGDGLDQGLQVHQRERDMARSAS